jgi:hypothetical protein
MPRGHGAERDDSPLCDSGPSPGARAFFTTLVCVCHAVALSVDGASRITLRGHLVNIITCLTHRITNAVTKSLKAKIQWIKYSSRGFRDRERFKLAINFHCAGLDLELRIQEHP